MRLGRYNISGSLFSRFLLRFKCYSLGSCDCSNLDASSIWLSLTSSCSNLINRNAGNSVNLLLARDSTVKLSSSLVPRQEMSVSALFERFSFSRVGRAISGNTPKKELPQHVSSVIDGNFQSFSADISLSWLSAIEITLIFLDCTGNRFFWSLFLSNYSVWRFGSPTSISYANSVSRFPDAHKLLSSANSSLGSLPSMRLFVARIFASLGRWLATSSPRVVIWLSTKYSTSSLAQCSFGSFLSLLLLRYSVTRFG